MWLDGRPMEGVLPGAHGGPGGCLAVSGAPGSPVWRELGEWQCARNAALRPWHTPWLDAQSAEWRRLV